MLPSNLWSAACNCCCGHTPACQRYDWHVVRSYWTSSQQLCVRRCNKVAGVEPGGATAQSVGVNNQKQSADLDQAAVCVYGAATTVCRKGMVADMEASQ